MGRTAKKATALQPLEVGAFYVRSIFNADWHVARKTGPTWRDYDRIAGTETREGAEELAALLNQAKQLADNWPLIRSTSCWKGEAPKDFVTWIIASSVCKAIGNPAPDSIHMVRMREAGCP